MASIDVHALCHDFVVPLVKRWSLFHHPKLVCDLLWPKEWSRNNRVPLLSLGLERPVAFLFFLRILQLFKLPYWMMSDIAHFLPCLIQELAYREAILGQQPLASSLAEYRCMGEPSHGQLSLVHISTSSQLIWDLWASINTYIFKLLDLGVVCYRAIANWHKQYAFKIFPLSL